VSLVGLALFLILLLFAILASGVWIAFALGAVGLVAMALKVATPGGPVLATSVWQASISWDLTALPMFIWMGEILYRTRLAEDMFEGLAPWLQRLPGRLLHVNVVGCTIFAAVSGSSAATCATIGRIALPELAKRGYDEGMAIGTLAGAGTLGLLIPPSIIMIVYATATDQSIAQLFIAGVAPGLLLALLFSMYIASWAVLNRGRMPPPEPASSFANRVVATRRLVPVVLLIVGVIGSIYGGVATPTEAAALGVVLATVIGISRRQMSWTILRDSIMESLQATAAIFFVSVGAVMLTRFMLFSGVPDVLADLVRAYSINLLTLLLIISMIYLVLGCFLDPIGLILITLPVVLPALDPFKVNLIWFGIMIVKYVEIGLMTPPVGMNVYAMKTVVGDSVPLETIFRGVAWFLVCEAFVIALLIAFPAIALWLPGLSWTPKLF